MTKVDPLDTIRRKCDPVELMLVAQVIYRQGHGYRTIEAAVISILRRAAMLDAPGYIETEGFCITAYLYDGDPQDLRYKVTLSAHGVSRMLPPAPPDFAVDQEPDLMRPLTPTQQALVRLFAVENGPHWRQRLLLAWVQNTTGPTLTHLRRTLGPQWLLGRSA
jgi:hypothetical protein